MKRTVIVLSLAAIFMSGCGDKPKSADSDAGKPAAGRPETRGIEAVGAVGYDGAAMRRSVDKALNATDARNAEQKKAIEQATGEK